MQIPNLPTFTLLGCFLCFSCRQESGSSSPTPTSLPQPGGGENAAREAECLDSLRQLYGPVLAKFSLIEKKSPISNSDYLVGLAVAAGKMNEACLEYHFQDN
jgi:hypothetical protein